MRCPNYIVMKKILITIIGLFSVAYGQLYQSMPQRGYGPVKNFWVDSVLIIPTNVTSGSNLSGGREVGKIRYNIIDSSVQVYTGSQWLAGNRSTGLPYWELATGGALTGNNNITGSHSLTFTDQTSFNVIKSGVARLGIDGTTTQLYGPSSGSGAIFSSSAATVSGNLYSELSGGASSGRTSSIRLTADETTINPSLGVLVIDSLAAGSSQTNIVGWTETAGADRGKLGALSLGVGVSLSSGTLNVSPPLSRIAAATGSNSIDNLNYLQTWSWNTHTGLLPALILNRTSTALGSSGGPIASITSSGANASANAVAQGLILSVVNTGSSSTNTALQITSSGATNNTAVQVNSGDVVLTPLTPSQFLSLDANKKMISSSVASSILRASINDENGTGAALFDGATTPNFVTGLRIDGGATSRKMLIGNGTNFVPSTETYAVPGANGSVLQSDGTNYIAGPIITNDEYTPEGTDDVNLDSYTLYSCQYIRVGTRVYVFGKIVLDATTVATLTSIDINLPISSSFTDDGEAAGTGWASDGSGFQINAIASGTKAKISFTSVDTTSHTYSFQFGYKIIE